MPAPEPVRPPHPIGSSFGDPHVLTWGGEQFDFHGACDLVLVDSPNFDDGKGLTIHIRTKIVTWWSYIDTAVVKLGDDTFEVQGGKHGEWKYWINGIPGTQTESGILEAPIGGYNIMFTDVSKKQKRFRLMELPPGLAVSFETFNDFVRVNVRADTKKHFLGALGLMGSYPDGAKVARDGTTVMTDNDAFGMEWQVQANEEKLFHNLEGVQAPDSCRMPTMAESESRRLGEASVDMEDARQACAHVSNPQDFDACVFDILATNDKDMAGAY